MGTPKPVLARSVMAAGNGVAARRPARACPPRAKARNAGSEFGQEQRNRRAGCGFPDSGPCLPNLASRRLVTHVVCGFQRRDLRHRRPGIGGCIAAPDGAAASAAAAPRGPVPGRASASSSKGRCTARVAADRRPDQLPPYSTMPGFRRRRANCGGGEQVSNAAPQSRHGRPEGASAAPSAGCRKARIAGQELIAAQPRERHLQAGLVGRLGDEPGVDAVDRGLVHGLQNGRQVVAELPLADVRTMCCAP